MRPKNSTLRFVQLTILACVLSACDGGLFGTGDGGPVIAVAHNPGSDNGMGDIDINSPVGENDPQATTQSFDNLQIGTTTTAPLINVINVSDQAITVSLVTNNDPLFTAPIAAGDFTQTAQLELGENNLVIINPETSNELLTIRPVNAGESTLTSLVVRNNTTQILDVVLLRSMSISLTPSIAQLRIVQADLLSNEDVSATFSLQPGGISPGGAELIFPNVSLASASSANYQSVSPGDYLLVDSLDRIGIESLNLQAGKIYTLIIISNPDSQILLHEDNRLAR
jgi:prolyl-tRNA editing enzyme YbaK/EbsC (Cys-tRNA(Pro) deacylase)